MGRETVSARRVLFVVAAIMVLANIVNAAEEREKLVSFSLYGGGLWGGIFVPKSTENATGEPGFGWHAGAESELNIRGKYFIATGLDYAQYSNKLTYDDPAAGYDGTRDITLGLLRMPVTYNVRLLFDDSGYPTLFLKPGAFVGYYMYDSVEQSGNLGDYELEKEVVYGFLLSTSYYPFPIADKTYLGFSVNGYWGMDVYQDDSGLEASLMGVDVGLSVKFF
ncbi:MAG: hypothetical protein GY771_10660 [bacterium]|nr:hypothetical protein [bacterium]